MMTRAVSSSRWALRRWTCASGGTTSVSSPCRRWSSSSQSSPSLPIRDGPPAGLGNGTAPAGAGGATEADQQLVALHAGAQSLPLGQHPGQGDLPPVAAHGDEEVFVVPRELDVRLLHEGNPQRQHVLVARALDPLRRTRVEVVAGVALAI